MRRRVTQKDILIFSISLFSVVMLWIAFSIYHAWVTSTVSPDLQIQIVPIAQNFDTQIINKLKNRQKILPASDLSNQIIASPSASPAVQTPTPAITIDASPTPATGEATPAEGVVIPTDTQIPAP